MKKKKFTLLTKAMKDHTKYLRASQGVSSYSSKYIPIKFSDTYKHKLIGLRRNPLVYLRTSSRPRFFDKPQNQNH